MVRLIRLGVPGGDLDDPTQDKAFMEQIGARAIGNTWFGNEHELTNTATGTLFTFNRIDYSDIYQWIIKRK